MPVSRGVIWRSGLALFVMGVLGVASVWRSSAQMAQYPMAPGALASGDFDEDGIPDLVVAVRKADGGGSINIHRGNAASIYPHSYPRSTDQPFFPAEQVAATPDPADFIGAGDFDADGHIDLVAARREGDRLMWRRGDGRGGFGEPLIVPLGARVTAMEVGEVNRADGLADIVVAAASADGARLLVYEGAEGALKNQPEILPLSELAADIAIGNLDHDWMIDIAVASGERLSLVRGRDRKLSLDYADRAKVAGAVIDEYRMPAAIRSLAAGNFIGRQRPSLALLLTDGSIRSFIAADDSEQIADDSDRRAPDSSSKLVAASTFGEVRLNSEVAIANATLISGRVSWAPVDQLLVADASGGRLLVVKSHGANDRIALPHTQTASGAAFELEEKAVSALPMRLNSDALDDLVVLRPVSGGVGFVMSSHAANFLVTNTNDSGDGSLRQAILDANFNQVATAINFKIAGSPPFTINLQTDLPRIFAAVSIDGTTQPGFSGRPIIEVHSANSQLVSALTLNGGNSVVRGLVLNRFKAAGIGLGGKGNNFVEGNYIGADLTGATRQSDGVGVFVQSSSNNVIGGMAAAAMNLISGNGAQGILISNEGANSNTVQGNLIGVNLAGTAALGNFGGGIVVFSTDNHVIGGAAPGARNVISGNGNDGIFLSGSGHLVQGNFIGLNPAGAGSREFGNSQEGIEISSARASTIGGTTVAARNVISGNTEAGLKIGASDDSALLVQGNYIGVAADGVTPMPNSFAPFNSFGGITASGGLSIGGATPGAGNLIANNGGGGVIVTSGKVTVRGNSIFASSGLGIDIFPRGVMANDDCDTDTGTNNLQNYPVITSAISSGNQTVIKVTLNSAPNTSYAVDFFVNAACNASGFGEGQLMAGGAQITTGGDCRASFEITLPIATQAGQFITATATDPAGNTSEFSMCAQVNTSSDIVVTQTTSAQQVNAGDSLNYTITVRNNGPDAASKVTINDNLPSELSIVSCAAPQANSCNGFTNNRSALLGSLAVGASASVTFFTKVNCNVADGAQISNTVSVSSSTSDPATANNTATSNVSVAIVQSAISPTSRAFNAAGGFGVINVTSSGNCGWTVRSNNAFIAISDSGGGIGAGAARYYVFPNTTGSQRAGSITIAGQTFSVMQAAGVVNPIPTPAPAAFGPCPTPRFRATTTYSVAARPLTFATGDFDGDSFPDLAMVTASVPSPNTVSILLNDGAGAFRAPKRFDVGAAPFSVATGDFNRDGKLDLAVALPANNVSVLIGDGKGNFGAPANFTTGAGARFVTTSDFNRDGELDLAVSNGMAGNISILLGDGAGGFGAATNYATGNNPNAIVVADFNSDGKSDLVVASSPGNAALLLGDGAGGFMISAITPPIGTPAGIVSTSVASNDFNGDGKADLVTFSPRPFDALTIYLGDDAGGFGAPAFFDINNLPGQTSGYRTVPTGVTSADFNGDGRADLMTTNQDGTVTIMPGEGNGRFRRAVSSLAGVSLGGLAVDDFDADGRLDVATGSIGGLGGVSGNFVSILFGDGVGKFGAPSVGSLLGSGLAAADFNRDGKLDLISGGNFTRGFAVSLGDGRGGFALSQYNFMNGPIYDRSVVSAATADFNGDGNPDFVIASGPDGGSGPSVFFGDGAGGFSPSTTSLGAYAVAVGDLNGDAKPDLALAERETSSVAIMLNDGTGKFGAPERYTGINRPWSIALADFNSDGKLDVTAPNQDPKTVSILFNDGAGKLGAPATYPVEMEPVFVATADFNTDGKPDLAAGNLNSGISVLLNDGTGKFGAQTKYLAGARVTSITVADFNRDGKTDLVATDQNLNRVVFLLGDGAGGFGTPFEFITGGGPQSVVAGYFNNDGKPDLAVINTGGGRAFPIDVIANVSIMLNTCAAPGNLANASSASFRAGRLGVESIASAFGANLASGTQAAPDLPLPTTLAGTSVKVKDFFGDERLAPLFFVSPGQINYLIPPGTATGTATISALNGANTVATGVTQISPIAPGLFAANSDGQGVAAAVVLRVSGGTQSFETVAVLDQTTNRFVARPIDLGSGADQVFLILFGTGVRGRSPFAKLSASIGGIEIPVLFAGAQPDLAGLDQINLPLSRALAGRGFVDIVFAVDGVIANIVHVNIK